MNALRKAIREIQTQNNPFTISGKVTEVDEANMTCTVVPNDADAEFFEVRLRALIDDTDTGIICVPKLESQVLISSLDNDDDTRFVTMTSELEKIIIRGEHTDIIIHIANEDGIEIVSKSKTETLDGNYEGSSSGTWKITASDVVTIEGSEIHLNGSGNGGLVTSQSVASRLNALENLLTAFIGVYNSHVHVTACGAGAGTASPTTSAQVQTPSTTQKTQLENSKVKH